MKYSFDNSSLSQAGESQPFAEHLAGKSKNQQITDSALDLKGQMGYLVEFGARPLKRKTVSAASGRLAETILSRIIEAGGQLFNMPMTVG